MASGHEGEKESTYMATIRASCPDCGDVEFTSEDVQVRVSGDDGSGTYAFHCPSCSVTVVKAAEARTIDLLVASGVHTMVEAVASDLEPRPDADVPITHDDLVRFHDLLHADDSWFAELASDFED
jgi:predicted RNA-binding Zn-ribbon protein involved in translation (DUF1610 family)